MTGSTPTNSASLQFEQQQAAQAQQKEKQRQKRLDLGTTAINNIFDGAPVYADQTQNYDWSTFAAPTDQQNQAAVQSTGQLATPAGVPDGYTAVQVDKPVDPKTAKSATSGLGPKVQPQGVGTRGNVFSPPSTAQGSTADPNGGKVWALKDASGKLYYSGDPLTYTSKVDTGQRTGGFGDDFYNAYKQKYLDYYMPDEEKQYDEAQRDLRYNLARSGNLASSVAGDKFGDLAYNDAIQKAQITSQANSAEGDLKTSVLNQKQALINQLYSTEDPTLTANLAQSAANGLQLKDPTLSPLSSLFGSALTAVGSAAANYGSPYSPYNGSTGNNVLPANTGSGSTLKTV